MPKGIPLKELDRSVTDDKSVHEFFKKHSQSAFTINMLLEEGFSTNVRKVVNRLLEKGSLQKSSVNIDGKRWEAAYYLTQISSNFIVKKVQNNDADQSGWKIVNIEVNGFEIETEFNYDSDDCLFWVNLTIQPETDVKILYWDSDEKIHSVLFSEISPILKDKNNLTLEINLEEDFDGHFEITHSGNRKKESKRRSRIIGEEFTQFAGPIGFNFEVNSSKRFILIKAIKSNEDEDEDDYEEDEDNYEEEEDEDDYEEEHIQIDSIGLGEWDEDEEEFEELIENGSHILLLF